MIPPEDQEREGGESAEAMGQLETLMLTLAGASLLALSSLAPEAVNKAAAALRRKAKKAASDGMGRVDEAVSRDLAGKLVLNVVTELSAANKGAGKARAAKKAINDAKKEAQKGAREAQRMARKMAACMVDDLNARFLREAARARAKAIGGRGTDGVGHRKAMQEAVVRLAKDSLTAYTYTRKDGTVVHVPVDVGIRRAVDNAGKQRQIEQTLAIAKSTGANMVEVSTTAGARKSHAEWQGKRYLLRGSSAKYPNFYKACHKGDPVDGIGGYNCRHQVAVCREGDPPRFRDPLEGTGYTQEQARKALTQQRCMENDLRRMKRQREVMRQNGLSTKDLDAKIKALDKGIDAHVAKHPKVLRRDKHRESIYERARKAAKAEGVVWLDKGQIKAVGKAAEAGKISRMEHNEPLVKLSRDVRNDFSISSVVNAKEFHDAFEDMPLPKLVSEGAYREAGRILQATDGTEREYLAAIDARTGKVIADNLGRGAQARKTGFTDDEMAKVNGCKNGVVLIHNHPASVPPSFRDLMTAATEKSVGASIVVGHDGSVWFISIPEDAAPSIAAYLERAYNSLADRYGDYAEIRAVNELLEKNKSSDLFEFRRLR